MGHAKALVLLNPLYNKAELGYLFIFSPVADDSNGDSLTYKMT
jgi:hypothetical protein